MTETFAQTMAATARTLRAQPDMEATLQAIVDLAATHLGGDPEVSISLLTEGKRIVTPASSGRRAEKADLLQYGARQGPCLDAIWKHETFQVEDLTRDQQYPRWSRLAAEQTGLRGVVSYQLFTDKITLGSLNVYTKDPRPYEPADRDEGLTFATHAALALHTTKTLQQLTSALVSRNLIGQAQGILMHRYDLTPERAFEFLTRVSQDSNIKLTEVARRVIAERRAH